MAKRKKSFIDRRPDWDVTCNCIRVCCDDLERRKYETDESYQERWLAHVRSAYLSGNDWNYLAGCPHCVMGEIVKKTENEN